MWKDWVQGLGVSGCTDALLYTGHFSSTVVGNCCNAFATPAQAVHVLPVSVDDKLVQWTDRLVADSAHSRSLAMKMQGLSCCNELIVLGLIFLRRPTSVCVGVRVSVCLSSEYPCPCWPPRMSLAWHSVGTLGC